MESAAFYAVQGSPERFCAVALKPGTVELLLFDQHASEDTFNGAAAEDPGAFQGDVIIAGDIVI